MAIFRESIDALKEARSADSEILEIISESVDEQMLTKNLQKKPKSPVMNFLIRHQPAKENHVSSAQKNTLNPSSKTPPNII